MPGSGSDKRKRRHVVRVRLSDDERSEMRDLADRSGLSMSAYLRSSILSAKPLRAERQPAINRQQVARLIGEIGQLAEAFRQAASHADQERCSRLIEAAYRDFSELRALCFEALGRDP